MTTDLEELSQDELQKLISNAQKALKSEHSRRVAKARRDAEEACKKHGLTLEEVMKADTGGSKGAPKYANPADPSQTWTGRGRKPNWLIEAMDNGTSLDDMAL